MGLGLPRSVRRAKGICRASVRALGVSRVPEAKREHGKLKPTTSFSWTSADFLPPP
jgi:hypothetical protein